MAQRRSLACNDHAEQFAETKNPPRLRVFELRVIEVFDPIENSRLLCKAVVPTACLFTGPWHKGLYNYGPLWARIGFDNVPWCS